MQGQRNRSGDFPSCANLPHAGVSAGTVRHVKRTFFAPGQAVTYLGL